MKHLPSLWAIWAQFGPFGMPREECSADVDGAIDLAVENEACAANFLGVKSSQFRSTQ